MNFILYEIAVNGMQISLLCSPFYCDYSWFYDAECAEMFGVTWIHVKVFEQICFFCSCNTVLLDFHNFHVDISKQFTVILKTFLEITQSWHFSSEREIQNPVMIIWVHSFFSMYWICWKCQLTEMPKQKILEFIF